MNEPAFHTLFSLQNEVNCLPEEQKVGLARMLTCLAGSSCCDGRDTLLLFVSPFKLFAQLCQIVQGETIRECTSAVGSSKGVNFFYTKCSLKLTLLGW